MDTEIVASLIGVGGETEPWRAVEIVWSSRLGSTVLLADCQSDGGGKGDKAEMENDTEHLKFSLKAFLEMELTMLIGSVEADGD